MLLKVNNIESMGGVYTILVIGDWPVLFLVKRELAIFKNVNCDWINSGDW